MKIVIARGRTGRRQGKRCFAPARRLRNAKKCVPLTVRGTLTRTSHPGANRVGFSGRIGSKALKPGHYQATLTATDAAKRTSKPKTIVFTIGVPLRARVRPSGWCRCRTKGGAGSA